MRISAQRLDGMIEQWMSVIKRGERKPWLGIAQKTKSQSSGPLILDSGQWRRITSREVRGDGNAGESLSEEEEGKKTCYRQGMGRFGPRIGQDVCDADLGKALMGRLGMYEQSKNKKGKGGKLSTSGTGLSECLGVDWVTEGLIAFFFIFSPHWIQSLRKLLIFLQIFQSLQIKQKYIKILI